MSILDISRKDLSAPTHIEDYSEYGLIVSIAFSPFEWSQDVVLIGFEDKILLVQLKFEEKLTCNVLTEFKHPCRCTSLSLSAETSLSILPHSVVFCVAGTDFKLRIYTSDLHENNTSQVLTGHESYINAASYDSENMYLASTGDDNIVKVWAVKEDYSNSCTFYLSSPGMSLCWHKSDISKLMVAEKLGFIRFYNIETRTPILSIDNSRPLTSADWSPADNQMIASLQLGELLVWNMTKPCLPLSNSIAFVENGGSVKFSNKGDLIAAVNSLDGTLKVVSTHKHKVRLSAGITQATNICWHYRYQTVCIGDDTKLCFWNIS